MRARLEFTIRSSIFDRSRKLVLDPDRIEFDDNDRIGEAPTTFLKEDIESLRYGIRTVRGIYLRFGRIYCIDIKDRSGQVIKLRLKSLYGIRLQRLHEKYVKTRQEAFNYYFHDILRAYLIDFNDKKPFELLGVFVGDSGVRLEEKAEIISWEVLGIKTYWSYFAIYSELAPDKYKSFEYLHVWNAIILQMAIQQILKMKFPARHSNEPDP